MRLLLALLLLIPTVLADENDDLRKEIQKLEKRAEKLLNEGKRADAFATLARIAELREKAKKGSKAKPAAAKVTPPPPPRRDMRATDVPQRRGNRLGAAQAALDRALAAGDLKAARSANAAAKKERQKLRRTQQQINRRRAERLGHLERQLAELKKLLQG